MLHISKIFLHSNYISLPQLSFDIMLRKTGVRLELMRDIDQILFVENNIRGGVSFINQRLCSASSSVSTEVEEEDEMLYIDGK